MTNFEKITESPAALGDFLGALPILEGPWHEEFRARFCAGCDAENCDAENCPNMKFKDNPGWWLTLEAERTAGA